MSSRGRNHSTIGNMRLYINDKKDESTYPPEVGGVKSNKLITWETDHPFL
jgi:hypothetical protein